MNEYIIFVYMAVFGLLGSLSTYIFYKFSKNSYIKFIPSIIIFIFCLYNVVRMYFGDVESMLQLAYFISLLLLVPTFIGAFGTSLYLHLKKKK